jgi:hypothetical protein
MSIGVRGRWRGAVALLAVVTFCGPAAAEVHVSDAGGGRLTVEAHDATLRQVIEALRAVRPLRLHTSDALARPVTGTYSGSLPRVLSHLLDGYDHVIHQTAAGIDLDVFSAGTAATGVRTPVRATATMAAPSTPAMAPNVGHRFSTNVDLDDETAATTARPPAAPARPPVAPAQPAVLSGSVQPPGAARISSNVDLDEERMSR